MKNFTLLDFDTKLLGIATAKILPENLSCEKLSDILLELKTQGIKLVFWCAAETPENKGAAEKNHGFLADDKLTYVCELKNISETLPAEIQFYPVQNPEEALLTLAYESGKYSRFRNDPKLTETQFKNIYREWMTNSTHHRVAQAVMVSRDAQGLTGMVTLGEKNGRGDIGLLAVAEHARGQGIGKILVKAAQSYFKQQGFAKSQVVTQGTNHPACRLYESCGYHIGKQECFYHFWL